MKIKIVVQDVTPSDGGMQQAEVWSGELELLRDDVYVTKISIIAEGEEHPICDIPFSLDTGHWLWVPALDLMPERFTSLRITNDTNPIEGM